MAKRAKANEKRTADTAVSDYRHQGVTRKNNPPAGLAAQGDVKVIPKAAYSYGPWAYNPHLPPVLRFDQHGKPDALPELLAKARTSPLSADETRLLADALRVQEPWLEWTGKRERRGFEVDPVALHIHERVSAQAILKVAARQDVSDFRGLFADPEQDYHEAVQFYRHDIDWSNRLILGDSLQVMSSLARREDLAGKVQMIYMDPPYGIKFASNFQPEVGKRDVKDKESDLTREPEMVKAYRDTWHLGIHSYLSYLRDRLIVAKELLADTGSIFVQISDENLHNVRVVIDEVFGRSNFISLITFAKTTGFSASVLSSVSDYLLWYARDTEKMRYRQLHKTKTVGDEGAAAYRNISDISLPFGTDDPADTPVSSDQITSQGATATPQRFEFCGRSFDPPIGMHWKTNVAGLARLGQARRLFIAGNTLRYLRHLQDFPVFPLANTWTDTRIAGFVADNKLYVVQTLPTVIERCMLMTTDPGDLVLDPTCGSGTSAYVAEQWGRRWITIDTSRVAIAIARQRLLTAKFEYYRTKSTSNDGAGVSLGGERIAQNARRSALSGQRDAQSSAGHALGGERDAQSSAGLALGGEGDAQSGAGLAQGGERIAQGGAGDARNGACSPSSPSHGFIYKTVPHITLKSIAQNVALDPIFARHEPILEAALKKCNEALSNVPPTLRTTLANKLALKERHEGKRAVTDADRRRWILPPENRKAHGRDARATEDARATGIKWTIDADVGGWYHWEVPFDTDPDWPPGLAQAVTEYRRAWRAKMDEVNACISASAEPEELVDQPEVVRNVVRVSGPFTVEAVQPPEMSLGDEMELGFDGKPEELETGFAAPREVLPRNEFEAQNIIAYLDQMLRYLKADGVRFMNNKQMKWSRLEPLFEAGRAEVFHAEGRWTPVGDEDADPSGGGQCNVGVLFGPQYGPVSAKMVEEGIRAANRAGYDDLVIAGFSFDGAATGIISENADGVPGRGKKKLRVHLAHVRPDVNPGMNGLLKESATPGGGQLFTVFGLPRVRVDSQDGADGVTEFVVTMEGVDVFSPVDNSITSTGAEKVAAWFLDSDYDGRTFCITQAFFPDRSAWDKLSRALNGKDGVIDAERFEALSGTTSLAFPAGKHKCAAVKVIDPRGNEVMSVQKLEVVR